MRIGVPAEIRADHEDRVGLVPASVRELTHRGHEVSVEAGPATASASPTLTTNPQAPKSSPGRMPSGPTRR